MIIHKVYDRLLYIYVYIYVTPLTNVQTFDIKWSADEIKYSRSDQILF